MVDHHPSADGRSDTEESKSDAQEQVAEAKTMVKEEARELKAHGKDAARQMKETAEEQVDKRSIQVADGLDSVVRAMYAAAEELDGGGQDRLAEYTRRAADQVDRVTDYLHDEDAPAMMADLEDMARANPGTFLGTSFAAGLAMGRFLRSSQASHERGERSRDQERRWSGMTEHSSPGGFGDIDRGPTIGGVHHQPGMSHQPPGGTTWDGSTTSPEHERRR
jgi:hypothetical protein